MRNCIKEFIEPTNMDKRKLWDDAVFVFDTNVILNLYRYSAKTRNSLLEAFENLKDRIWIPYQVAYEYMNKRCEVIYETVQRYDQFAREIETFTSKAVETLRLTSGDEESSELKRYLHKWLDTNKDSNLLVVSADEDEILNKILLIFENRVGNKIDEVELNQIKAEGKTRYAQSIPPGYKDDKKKNSSDDNNAYGDLIIWKQILNYAQTNKVGIVYVTHDQKEDWWNIVKGKTIGPRIELRREFATEANQNFHMYSMNSFISTYNQMNPKPIEKSALNEILNLDKALLNNRYYKRKESIVSISEKIINTEETLDKIHNRIQRRKKIINDIDNKYKNNNITLPNNIQLQYDNTITKLKELGIIYEDKCKELEFLKNSIEH